MNRIFIIHRSFHHSKYSGYSKLIDNINGKVLPKLPERIPYILRKILSNSVYRNLPGYDTQSIEKDWQLLLELRKNNNQTIVHYLNGERDIRYMLNYYKNSERVKLIASFHKPPSILIETIKQNKYLKYLDGVIALGTKQANLINDRLQIKQLEMIHHGVDTDYFHPEKNQLSLNGNEKRLLFVGQHLRDFDIFNDVVDIIKSKKIKIDINVVVLPFFIKYLRNKELLNIHSGISDDMLRKLYQGSTCLFIPFKDVVACNSILEALACGTPIITSKIGDNPDYLDDDCSIMLDINDKDSFFEAIMDVMNNDSNQKLRIASRKKSLNYDWKVISKKVERFYRKVL